MQNRLWIMAMLVCVAGCTRPQAVRDVATNAQPLVANLQRSAVSMSRHIEMQRQDLIQTTSRYNYNQRVFGAQVTEMQEDWLDANNQESARRLERYRARDAEVRADPLASLTPVAITAAPRTQIKVDGLTGVARALERLQGKQGLSAADLLSFSQSVSTEIEKLEQEEASVGPAAAASTP